MNSEIFDRLFRLFQMLGADLADNTCDSAELYAYTAGLESVLKYFDEIKKDIDLNTSKNLGLALYCEMTGTDGELDDNKKREEVKKRLIRDYGDYKLNDIYLALADVSNELTIMTSKFEFEFNLNNFGKEFDLVKLAKVINEFVPPCTVAEFMGDGATFDKWDATSCLFEDYDNINLPFQMLDQLK